MCELIALVPVLCAHVLQTISRPASKACKTTKPLLGEFEIGRIIELDRQGKSLNDIAQVIGRSKSGVGKLLQRYRATGATVRRPSTGRPRKTDAQQDKQILKEVMADRGITAKQIRYNLNLNHVSDDLIERRISEGLGFKSCFKIKKNFVSETNRRKRLEFAEAHKNWTVDQWKQVLWSDESPFVLRFNGRIRVWRLPSERYEPFATRATVKHDKKINVWGCFAARGVGKIRRVNGILERNQMLTILQESMMDSVHQLFPQAPAADNYIFQQDNDPKHTSNLVKGWLETNQVPLLPWPSQSPDLNPIENLWAILDRRLQGRTPQNEDELFAIIESGWNALDPSLLTSLIESMPRRCAAVIKNRGYCTKY